MRRRVLLVLVLGGPLVIGLCCISSKVLGLWPDGEGSPAYAKKWKHAFEGISDPETAQSTYPGVVTKRYEHERWIFGTCQNSHNNPWGGTLVVKDSTGRVRAFFGHVCGDHRFLETALASTKSLDDFYQGEYLKTFQFTEYTFP